MIWVDLAELDFAPGGPVRVLTPGDVHLSGEVSGWFEPDARPPF